MKSHPLSTDLPLLHPREPGYEVPFTTMATKCRLHGVSPGTGTVREGQGMCASLGQKAKSNRTESKVRDITGRANGLSGTKDWP